MGVPVPISQSRPVSTSSAAISQVAAGWKCSLYFGIYGTKGSVQWELQVVRVVRLHAQAVDRQGEQARSAAGKQRQQQVIGCQRAGGLQDAARRGLAGLVRHRMAGFDDLDMSGRQAVLIARDRDAFEPASPVLLDRQGHRGSGLARGGDECAALRHRRQMRAQDLQRIGRGHRGLEALF